MLLNNNWRQTLFKTKAKPTNLHDYLLQLPRPEPSAGLDYYRQIKEEAISFEKRRKENYEKYLAAKKGAKVNYLPIKLDIENVSRCNFACEFCIVSKWEKRQRADDMSLDDFKNIIDTQYGLIEIKLNGLGEPTLQGDDFFEMIKYARQKKIWVRITTNASLLHLKDNYKKLVDSDVCEVDISIDGYNKEKYEKIRVGGKYEITMENCKLLNEYGEAQGKKRTKMWTLVQRENFNDLERHVELARDLKFDNLVFSLDLHGWGNDDLLKRNLAITVNEQLTVERVDSLLRLADDCGVKLAFWNVSTKFDYKKPETRCPWPFERAVISSDLKVVPCCMVADPNAFHFKPKETITDVWEGEEYQKFREQHVNGDIPPICLDCYKKN